VRLGHRPVPAGEGMGRLSTALCQGGKGMGRLSTGSSGWEGGWCWDMCGGLCRTRGLWEAGQGVHSPCVTAHAMVQGRALQGWGSSAGCQFCLFPHLSRTPARRAWPFCTHTAVCMSPFFLWGSPLLLCL
jgi:hypothetical protein